MHVTMATSISFGDANSGFQAGTINGDVNASFHQHLPPGKLNAFQRRSTLMAGRSQSEQKLHRTHQLLFPSSVTRTLWSAGRSSTNLRTNVRYRGRDRPSLGWVVLGE